MCAVSANQQEPDPSTVHSIVTIRDVARMAGVSIGTVSKALNDQGQLKQETRRHVRQVALDLGFQPNNLAQSLHRKHTFTVGLISTDSYGRFSMPLLEGIEDALGAAQFNVFLCNAADDSERERQHLQSLLAKRVDGIIVTARKTDARPPIDLGRSSVPVLYAYSQVADELGCSLLPDDEHGGYLAVNHLLGLGHIRLAYVTGPEHFMAVQERLSGARRAFTEHGLPWPDNHALFGTWTEAWGYRAFPALQRLGVSAVFCGNDLIARGVADAAREHGVAVPGDLSVVGFDNWEVMAATTRPPLTTIDMDLRALGHQAAETLLRMIGGQRQTGVRKLPCRLVVRESTARLHEQLGSEDSALPAARPRAVRKARTRP